MYKNVSLRSRSVAGRSTWRLLGPDGKEIEAFTAFAESVRTLARNSIEAYCRHLAEFIDYLIEVTFLVGQGNPLTKMQLTEAIEAYGEYLQLGVDSQNNVAKSVAELLGPGSNSANSIVPKKAAIRRFLRLSEDVRKELAETAKLRGHGETAIAKDALLPEVGQRRALTQFEVRAMQARSMIAGVIAGGPKFIDAVGMAGKSAIAEYDHSRAFPYNKVMDLIDVMPTHRDKAIYSLLAASGCRTHEALQVLLQDVDVAEGMVRIVDPKSRLGHASYRVLDGGQRDQLAFKGRTSELTLLIEPFAGRFFSELERYLETERIDHGLHAFLFQYLVGEERGLPFFLSAAASRREVFTAACCKIGVHLPPGTGPHSLRHLYGTYLLNYFPRSNGEYGLPLPMVQQLMGHSDIKQTMKYARYDRDLLKLELQHANEVLFRRGTPQSLIDLKLEALEAQISKLRIQQLAGV